jgi:hypothetical protein
VTATTAQVRADIEAQPRLAAGEEGWWKVYGASPRDIQAGDFVLTRDDTDGFLVDDVYVNEAWRGIRTGIVVDGERQSIGTYCPIVLLRRGTKATLAGSVR